MGRQNARGELSIIEKKAIGSSFKMRFYPWIIDSASGVTLQDADGSEYLDFSAGAAAVSTGHCHPAVARAVGEQATRLAGSAAHMFPATPALQLAERLIGMTPGRYEKKVWFGASGSDACDAAFDFLPAATGRRRIITFLGAFHGLGVGGRFLSSNGISSRYLGSNVVVKAPYPYQYRSRFHSPQECSESCIAFIEKEIFASVCPPGDVACVLVEPIESVAGEIVPPDDFLPRLRELCDRHGIMLGADEVKTGFGRTGKLFAVNHTKTIPDFILLGKPIASGYPLGAFVGRRQILDSESVSHVSSAGGHPVSCAAGLATIGVIESERLVENSATQGSYIRRRAEEMMRRHPTIGDVRGRGLMIGLELVRNRRTKEPASRDAALVSHRAGEKGLAVVVSGIYSNVIEITPPLVIRREEAERGMEILEEALSDVEAGSVRGASE